MPDENDYYITYGFGYTCFLHVSNGIEQTLEIFVPKDEPIKVNLLHLENRFPESKNLKIVYYIKPVLDEDELKSNGSLSLEYNSKSNIIFIKNMANKNIKDRMFVSCSEKIKSYTGSKTSFLGKRGFKFSRWNKPSRINKRKFIWPRLSTCYII